MLSKISQKGMKFLVISTSEKGKRCFSKKAFPSNVRGGPRFFVMWVGAGADSHLWIDWQINTHDWKHYLPTTSLPSGNEHYRAIICYSRCYWFFNRFVGCLITHYITLYAKLRFLLKTWGGVYSCVAHLF